MAEDTTIATGPIGPYDPDFHKEVGRYFLNSPPPEQKTCLRLFFAELRIRPVMCPHRRGQEFLLVYTCGHVLTFSANGQKVVMVQPGIIQ